MNSNYPAFPGLSTQSLQPRKVVTVHPLGWQQKLHKLLLIKTLCSESYTALSIIYNRSEGICMFIHLIATQLTSHGKIGIIAFTCLLAFYPVKFHWLLILIVPERFLFNHFRLVISSPPFLTLLLTFTSM